MDHHPQVWEVDHHPQVTLYHPTELMGMECYTKVGVSTIYRAGVLSTFGLPLVAPSTPLSSGGMEV